MKVVYFLLGLVVGLMLQKPAHAEIDAVGLHLYSNHNPSREENNDLNVGGYVHTSGGYIVGAFWNSYKRTAVYAGWRSPEWHRLSFSVAGVTGYFSPVTPIFIPHWRFLETQYGSFSLSGSPVRLEEKGQAILHLSFEMPLK